MTTPPTNAPANGQPPPDDLTTPLVAAYIKKNWDSHYRAAWEKLGSPTGLRDGTTWNWPAALIPVIWLLYRRQYLFAIGWFVAGGVLSAIPNVSLIAWIVSIVLFGMYGDRIILRKAWQAADAALRQHGPGEKALAQVAQSGGVSSAALGCILVFPGIVIIGILAAIAIPKFASTKQKAYLTEMRSDLASIRNAEEAFYTDSGRYTADLGAVFTPSAGVSVPSIKLGDKAYSATVTHAQLPNRICGIAVGMPNPVNATTGEGEAVCR
jgi:hypothetical protein